jgi:hypothetical protein
MRPNAYREHFRPTGTASSAHQRFDGAELLAACERSAALRAQEWSAPAVGPLALKTIRHAELYLDFFAIARG